MNQVSNIIISRKDFKHDEELYDRVAQQIRLLLEAGYVIVAEDVEERGGTIVIQYAPANAGKEFPRPYWLMTNESMAAMDVHVDNEVSRAENILKAAKKAGEFSELLDALKGNGEGGSGGFDA